MSDTNPTVTRLPSKVCTNYSLQLNERLLSVSIPFSQDPNGQGLVGILTCPPTSMIPEEDLIKNPTSTEQHYPPTHKLALILHGKGGHKNYCYQALLAQELATKLGVYSFRFDFRGCGDSQANEDIETGRKVSQDIEDIELVLAVFTNGAQHDEIGINLIPNSIVAHSRGSVAMFMWALKQQEKMDKGESYQFVPNLVNAAGRFKSNLLLVEFGEKKDNHAYLNQYRLGKYQDIKILKSEVVDLGSQDLEPIKYLDGEIQVLSIYGLADHIVPVEDSTNYANLLGSRHKLTLIPYADHNFYGHQQVNDENKKKINPFNLPLTKRGHVNWNHRVTSDVVNWLHTLNDTERYRDSTKIVSHFPRWRQIEGIANFRDLGGWKTRDNRYVKAGVIFRSANPSTVTERGKQQLRDLGITTFFDFRSVGEYKKAGGLDIEGIDCRNVPVYNTTDLSPQAIALRYRNLLASWYTFKYVYRDALKYGVTAFREVFEFIRDHPGKPLVFNCQAGKDRTGVMAMLILLLLKVDTHTVAKEYELTTIGLRPDHGAIKTEFLTLFEGLEKKIMETAANGHDISHFQLGLTPEQMFENLISSKYESMVATVELLNNEYGSVEGYMENQLGFTKKDIEIIRNNLLTGHNAYPDQSSIWRHRVSSGSLL